MKRTEAASADLTAALQGLVQRLAQEAPSQLDLATVDSVSGTDVILRTPSGGTFPARCPKGMSPVPGDMALYAAIGRQHVVVQIY